jgi:hypothetical protein
MEMLDYIMANILLKFGIDTQLEMVHPWIENPKSEEVG